MLKPLQKTTSPSPLINNPIPCIPFPLVRGRGRFVLRGASAPLTPPKDKESLREAKPLFIEYFPLSFPRRGGVRG